MTLWLRFLCLICTGLAVLQTAQAQFDEDEVSCDAPLQHDNLRFPHARVAERTFKDLAAIPASVVNWDAADFGRFAAFTVPTVALMVPPHPSLDVRIQDWTRTKRSDALDRFFPKIKSVPEGITLAVAGAVIFSAAYVRDDRRLFEYGTLAVEALAVSQFFHITMKLLTGRESPYQGEHQGEFHGPTKLLFPGGTPSGHASTAYAMLAVTAFYWDKWPLHVIAQLGGLYVSTSLIYNRQHFVSDVIWGAGLGYYIGRWIVKHRSSRYRCKNRSQVAWYQKVMWLPIVSGLDGVAIAASYRY